VLKHSTVAVLLSRFLADSYLDSFGMRDGRHVGQEYSTLQFD